SGRYKLAAIKEGFYSNSLFDFIVEEGQTYEVKIKLLSQKGRWNAEYCFMIGGIEVKSLEREVIPEEMTTVRRIESGEIEHLQADNLGDVLTLIPGIEKSKQLGLASRQSIGIRKIGSGDLDVTGLQTFGTTIIVDGNEINNDAVITAMTASETGGIDMRMIPADNISSVEVISGIPSVEYGNFADGVIKVETKSNTIRKRLRARYNPDTKGANFSSGHKLGDGMLDYHANYAFSERDKRKTGDEYHRFYFNAGYKIDDEKKPFNYSFNGSYTRTLDDEKPTDIYQMQSWNHGFLSTGTFRWNYKAGKNVKYDGTMNLDLNRKDIYKSKYVPDQIDTVFGYIGEMREEGKEWDATFKMKREKTRKNEHGHTLKNMLGIDLNYQVNTGSGFHLDSIYNYYGAYSTQRSYRFDDYPGFFKLAIYGETNRSWKHNGKSYELMTGLRYDAVNVKGFDFAAKAPHFSILDAPQGQFLSPRLASRVQIAKNFYWRTGVGRSIKAVSMAQLYRKPAYVKTPTDSGWVEISYNQENRQLKSYYSDKAESSLDWKPTDYLGMSLTAYYTQNTNQPTGVSYPVGYETNPDTITSLTWSRYENVSNEKNSGLEFSLQTKRIYNLKFVFTATYRTVLNSKARRIYATRYDTSWQELWYPAADRWQEKIILGQQTSYINQRLGVWITVDLQYIPYDTRKNIYHSKSKIAEIDGHNVEYFQGMSYWYDAELYKYGQRWIINARISKSLGLNSELSFYVNNLLDDRGWWQDPYYGSIRAMNAPIYFGLELSVQW
ncbi:MAG TPA: hypothetical protein ENN84_10035, partial [Candidatus Marinimicrobia bacterium]|nr:hypothetical protein [Candidatus Neomarinimicrobiota bacterium]